MAALPFAAPGGAPFRKPKGIGIENNKGKVPAPFDYQHINANDDEVVWISLDGNPFEVEFDPKHKPFAQTNFSVPAGGTVHSGPVVYGKDGEEFKYSVTGPGGTTDPKIIIDR